MKYIVFFTIVIILTTYFYLRKNNENFTENSKNIDCKVSNWSKWTDDSKCESNNTKVQSRKRKILIKKKGKGKKCPKFLKEYRRVKCNENIDCKVSEWSEWKDKTKCSKECGGGEKTVIRSREIIREPKGEGKKCPKLQEDNVIKCNEQECPVNCIVSEWTEWSNVGECSKTCGGGEQEQIRTREILQEPLNGGELCPSDLKEIRKLNCNSEPCDGIIDEGLWSEWKDKSECNKMCSGTKIQERIKLDYVAKNGDKKCELLNEVRTTDCEKCQEIYTNTPYILEIDTNNMILRPETISKDTAWRLKFSDKGGLFVTFSKVNNSNDDKELLTFDENYLSEEIIIKSNGNINSQYAYKYVNLNFESIYLSSPKDIRNQGLNNIFRLRLTKGNKFKLELNKRSENDTENIIGIMGSNNSYYMRRNFKDRGGKEVLINLKLKETMENVKTISGFEKKMNFYFLN